MDGVMDLVRFELGLGLCIGLGLCKGLCKGLGQV